MLIATGSATAAPFGVFDLRTDFDARLDGRTTFSGAGQGVAAAGDVNGDGREDLLVRASRVEPRDFDDVYVVFGREDWGNLELGSLGPEDGFVIKGTMGPCLGFGPFESCLRDRTLDAAGDVNGDGLDDVIVGSPHGLTVGIGAAYVVFGKTSGTPVDVAALGSAGFKIAGIRSEDSAGHSVSGAGDVNGDGLDDVIVGGPTQTWSFTTGGERRAAYVIFGKPSTATVQLSALGGAGFMFEPGDLDAGRLGARNVAAVAGIGDTNGDGLSDVAVGMPLGGVTQNGRVVVIFGKDDTGTVSGAALGEAGYRIENTDADVAAHTGRSLAGAGDVNADGAADLIIGAPGSDRNARDSGSAFVVFGKTDTGPVNLSGLSNGFRIDGKGVLDAAAGWSVDGGHDMNGDGHADMVVGEALGAFEGRSESGSAYVVFGKDAPEELVRLGGLAQGQVEIGGADVRDFAGDSVGIGDFDGDGRADVAVGAAGRNGFSTDSGSAYVLLTPLLPRELSLSPEQATNTIGDEHCVTAHAMDPIGAPLAGFDVRFDVTGVNTTSGTEQTGSGGDAEFCYEGSLAMGTDQINAFPDGNGNGIQDPGEPSATASKEWVAPQSGPDCAVSFHGQITTQAGGKATLSGKAETTGAEASGRHSYMDRGAGLRIKARDVDVLACAEDGGASLFGEARLRGVPVVYRIDLQAGTRNRGTYRIRLDTGYDSGRRTLRGSLRIDPF